MTTGTPKSWLAYASDWPWLPVLALMTPRCRSAGGQSPDEVDAAAHLKGSYGLQVFALGVVGAAEHLRERVAVDERRRREMRADKRRGFFHRRESKCICHWLHP